jgi:signal transduction histidine kinase
MNPSHASADARICFPSLSVTNSVHSENNILFQDSTQDMTSSGDNSAGGPQSARFASPSSSLSSALLAARIEDLEAFSYSVAHDLKSLLSIVKLSAQLLESPTEDHSNVVSVLRTGCDRMSRVIDGHLRLAGVARNDAELEQVDLSCLARQIVRELSKSSSGTNVSFEVQENMWVQGDSHMIYLLLSNLIDNAVKFTESSPHRNVSIGSREVDGETQFFVTDTGIGFPEEASARLFLPFSRLHGACEYKGTGIGLAICRRIVERHRGRIWANSSSGEGATFFFTLPIPSTKLEK